MKNKKYIIFAVVAVIFALLNVAQRQEMIDFALEVKQQGRLIADMPHIVSAIEQEAAGQPLTEIREKACHDWGLLHLCGKNPHPAF